TPPAAEAGEALPAQRVKKRGTHVSTAAPPQAGEEKTAEPGLNPVALYQREGADGLGKALETQTQPALLALVSAHNLDPGGEAEALDGPALIAHVVAQAKRRAERDAKLFDY